LCIRRKAASIFSGCVRIGRFSPGALKNPFSFQTYPVVVPTARNKSYDRKGSIMNKSIQKAIFAVALSSGAFSVFASNLTLAPEVPDQVVASFDRLLNHPATSIAMMEPASSRAESDPLHASVNAVLWEQPSYHLPVKYAYHDAKQKQRN
jgi:hypothetical protein